MGTENKTDYFDTLGDDFDSYMSDYDVERRRRLVFSVLLKNICFRGSRVLEVGCGTGRFSEEIVRLGGELAVLDIGPNLVASVSERLGCRGIVADACNLPFPDNTFDVIISSECIEHTHSPERVIREMCRVCSVNGQICITTPNRLWYPILVLSQKLGIRRFSGIENWIWPRQAAAILVEEGMTELVLSGCHLWPFQLKFTRPVMKLFDHCGRWLYPVMINFGITARKS